jgi:hypothetical protein
MMIRLSVLILSIAFVFIWRDIRRHVNILSERTVAIVSDNNEKRHDPHSQNISDITHKIIFLTLVFTFAALGFTLYSLLTDNAIGDNLAKTTAITFYSVINMIVLFLLINQIEKVRNVKTKDISLEKPTYRDVSDISTVSSVSAVSSGLNNIK